MVDPHLRFAIGWLLVSGSHHVMRITLSSDEESAVTKIAASQNRTRSEVVHLLIASGLRVFHRRRSLLCGFPNCTRRGCCKIRSAPPPHERVVPMRKAK